MPSSLPTFKWEKSLWRKGYLVVGVDEVGRGSLAGPLVVAAVCFPPLIKDKRFKTERLTTHLRMSMTNKVEKSGINDSKKLSSKKREKLAKIIRESCLAFATASVSSRLVDRLGVVKATQKAIRQVVRDIRLKIGDFGMKKFFVLIDAFYVKNLKGVGLKNQQAIIHGDEKSISIAAASIVAKVERDQTMIKLYQKHPQYQWHKNKGYGTPEHIKALKKYGASRLHRRSFLRMITKD